MSIRLLPGILAAVLIGTLGVRPARADVYTWVDAQGRVNLSNLVPPAGVTVKSVAQSPPRDPAREAAARDAALQSEIQQLNARVEHLQDALLQSRRDPLPVNYSPPPPQFVQYTSEAAPVAYDDTAEQLSTWGCDSAWNGCGYWWGPGFLQGSAVVVPPRKFARFGPVRRPGYITQRPVPRSPVHMTANVRRR